MGSRMSQITAKPSKVSEKVRHLVRHFAGLWVAVNPKVSKVSEPPLSEKNFHLIHAREGQ